MLVFVPTLLVLAVVFFGIDECKYHHNLSAKVSRGLNYRQHVLSNSSAGQLAKKREYFLQFLKILP